MKAIDFPEATVTIAKDQPEYLPLRALFIKDTGAVITCWHLTFWERVRLLFTGRVWHMSLTFGRPVQPLNMTLTKPFHHVYKHRYAKN